MPRGLQAELKQKIPFASREAEAYLSLLRTTDALQTQVEAQLKEFGLTGTAIQRAAHLARSWAGRLGVPRDWRAHDHARSRRYAPARSSGRSRLRPARACQARSPRHLRKDHRCRAEASARDGWAARKVWPGNAPPRRTGEIEAVD